MTSIGNRPRAGLSSSALVTAVLLSVVLALVPAEPAHAAFPGASGQIVFVSTRISFGNPEIYSMNADGTSPTRLTNNPANDYTPAWSPDGTRILFGSTRDQVTGELYVMNADGSGQTRLSNNTSQEREPTWSPNGSQIAFTSRRDGNDEIYIMNADGSGETRITNNAASDSDPAWSPNGTRIAFVSNRDGNSEIYLMNSDGSNLVQFTNTFLQTYSDPDWSPDGTRLAFDDGAQIFVRNADGTGGLQYTTTGSNFQPAWSPDGRYIAIYSTRDGNAEIYLIDSRFDGDAAIRLTNTAVSVLDVEPDWQPIRMPGKLAFTSGVFQDVALLNFDGTPPIILTNQIGETGYSPAWSPLGTQMAFTSGRDGNSEIYVMNANGSGQTRVTNHPAPDSYPAWSPDGTKIAFATVRDTVGQNDYSEIYVMNADGTNPTRLTNNSPFYVDEAPDWSPDGTRIAYHIRSLIGLGIFVMNADGSNVIPLTNGSGDYYPAWSPDGTKIAFARFGDIFTMNPDGSGQTPLTSNPGYDDSEPSWSPDGAWIAFRSNRDGHNEIYAIRADGSTQIRLTNDFPKEYSEPAWQLGTDTDDDGFANVVDNCTMLANPTQCDSDFDGYGNRCDGDFNNNGVVNAQDNVVFRLQLGQPSVAPTYHEADLNCSGAINAQDTALFRQRLGTVPGPSGLVP